MFALLDIISQDSVARSLVSITKLLTEIKAEAIHKDSVETVKNIALIISPFLTGFILYLWTRNKEFRIKRAEICGDITQAIYEYKQCIFKDARVKIHYYANVKIIEIIEAEDFYSDMEEIEIENFNASIYYDIRDSLKKKIKTENEKQIKLKERFYKHFSTYKHYLVNFPKDDFNKLTTTFLKLKPISYSYDEQWSIDAVNMKRNEYLENCNKDLTEKYKVHIERIENFIDENAN
jgi:hypothetical protein